VSDPRLLALGHGRFLVADADGQRLAHAVRTPAGVWVHLDGRVYVVGGPLDDDRASAAAAEEASLGAPMPATVLSVHVQPDQLVARGDILVTLEAMKMELPIRAPRDGRVAVVACRAGELVQPGTPLVQMAGTTGSPEPTP
jgi:acetyl/propionyl-CoA carboxylase alpha subunit